MFRFRLETLLRVRRRREEMAALELAAAQRERLRQEELLEALDAGRRRERRQALERLAQRGMVARDLLLQRDYERALDVRLAREGRRLTELAGVCEHKRQDALARSRERKVLERLRERQLKTWRLEEGRRQQKRLDELSGRRALLGREEER